MNKETGLSTVSLPSSRNIVIDILKGILILLMVIGHSGAPEWLTNSIYSFHMPCFFIISGLLFSYGYLNEPWKFIKKRIKSIWWPFTKWTCIFVLLHNLFYSIGLYETSLTNKEIFLKILKACFMFTAEQLIGGFWFLTSLFFSSIACIIYYKIFGISKTSLIIGIISLLLISQLFCVYKFHFIHLNKVNLLATAYFMTGTLINSIKITNNQLKTFIIITSIILLGISGFGEKIEIVSLTKYNLIPYFIKSVIISTGFIFIIEFYKYKSWLQYFSYLGVKTMDILIVHFIAFRIVSVFKSVIYNMDIQENLKAFPVIMENNSFFWIVYVVIGILICLSYSKIKEYLNTGINLLRNQKLKIS